MQAYNLSVRNLGNCAGLLHIVHCHNTYLAFRLSRWYFQMCMTGYKPHYGSYIERMQSTNSYKEFGGNLTSPGMSRRLHKAGMDLQPGLMRLLDPTGEEVEFWMRRQVDELPPEEQRRFAAAFSDLELCWWAKRKYAKHPQYAELSSKLTAVYRGRVRGFYQSGGHISMGDQVAQCIFEWMGMIHSTGSS
jgi:hypothetical protein